MNYLGILKSYGIGVDQSSTRDTEESLFSEKRATKFDYETGFGRIERVIRYGIMENLSPHIEDEEIFAIKTGIPLEKIQLHNCIGGYEFTILLKERVAEKEELWKIGYQKDGGSPWIPIISVLDYFPETMEKVFPEYRLKRLFDDVQARNWMLYKAQEFMEQTANQIENSQGMKNLTIELVDWFVNYYEE